MVFAYDLKEQVSYLVSCIVGRQGTEMNPFENLSTTTRMVANP